MLIILFIRINYIIRNPIFHFQKLYSRKYRNLRSKLKLVVLKNRKSKRKQGEREMGSTSSSAALISHLQLSKSCFKLVQSARTQLKLNSLKFSHSRRRKLEFAALRSRKGFGRAVCFAAVDDDVKGNRQQDFSKTCSEDRADVANISIEETPRRFEQNTEGSALYNLLYPNKDLLPDDKEMTVFDHLEELRQRIFVSVLAVGAAMLGCFAFSKELIMFLEAPVKAQGVRFLQLAPGEFFFTTLKVSGYCGLLLGSPIILYEIIAFVLPGLTRAERRFLGPIVLGSSILFYAGIAFSYSVLTPAALNFFVTYAEGVVESLWSIDQYFEFVLVLMFSTGLSFQVPVIQFLLGQLGLVSGDQMLSIWRYVVVGAVIVAAILTPSTDPLTQVLLAAPLLGLYLGGAWVVKLIGR
ncbi:sec-independent protein translocase protein TATC, chloroplastic-like [Durio zibethinus]|uniref:Sec-independent protein translocase protein TATC, chloroplastic-like n=1 Tax=Durio zibethinus TaxID=66656 RepID=A0A6P6BFP3_DURZI|nr:sec-independent protein translocase protein TATC, chloroplastic-like [Durio zibethinus]